MDTKENREAHKNRPEGRKIQRCSIDCSVKEKK